MHSYHCRRALVDVQVAVMSFKRKFNTPTKMAPGDDDDDDDDVVARRSYDSRPSSARAADSSVECWSSTTNVNIVVDSPDRGTFADTDRTRYGLSARTSPDDGEPTPLVGREVDGGDAWRQAEVDGDDDVMGNIRSVIGSAATLDEKQRVLSMMISQLQSLKQNLFQQKSNGVRCRSLLTIIKTNKQHK